VCNAFNDLGFQVREQSIISAESLLNKKKFILEARVVSEKREKEIFAGNHILTWKPIGVKICPTSSMYLHSISRKSQSENLRSRT